MLQTELGPIGGSRLWISWWLTMASGAEHAVCSQVGEEDEPPQPQPVTRPAPVTVAAAPPAVAVFASSPPVAVFASSPPVAITAEAPFVDAAAPSAVAVAA
jgi:hypothetical protein